MGQLRAFLREGEGKQVSTRWTKLLWSRSTRPGRQNELGDSDGGVKQSSQASTRSFFLAPRGGGEREGKEGGVKAGSVPSISRYGVRGKRWLAPALHGVRWDGGEQSSGGVG